MATFTSTSTSNTNTGKGRPAKFASKKAVAKALGENQKLSRYHTMQLVDMGYLEVEEVQTQAAQRGRPAHVYSLTGKAKGLLALAKNW